MGRARGANATSALAFEAVYGQPPSGNWLKAVIVSSGLGAEQGLVEDDALGLGREPGASGDDVVTNTGDLVMPVDVRMFGYWLKAMLGAPTTTAGLAAKGSLTFSAQPTANATITIAGQAFTFVSGAPTANQIKIGANLAETVANAVRALNASAVPAVKAARYSADPAGRVISIAHGTVGTAGNSFAVVAGSSPASNAAASGATLTGGSASGGYTHVWTSGAMTLPSWSLETGLPEVPSYASDVGCVANTLTLPLARSGNFNATLAVIGQTTTTPVGSTIAGTPTERVYERFTHYSAQVEDSGVPLAELTSGSLVLTNNAEGVEVIRNDGCIAGVDPGKFGVRSELALLYSDTSMMTRAEAGEALDLVHRWSAGGWSLTVRVPRLRLPKKAKRPLTGPGGISATYAGQGEKSPDLGKSVIVTLVNDVAAY